MPVKPRKGVLFINLGSPDSPDIADIRKYLKEFLSDKRVMTMPAILRWMIVNLFIAPFRPAAIQKNYQSIWNEEGFPLIVHGKELTAAVSRLLGEEYLIELAMRYGKPTLHKSLEHLRHSSLEKLLIFPLFPQYASATTGSIVEKTMDIIKSWTVIPELKIISSFYQHSAFIHAWISQAKPFLESKPDHILFSFHGLPESHIAAADVSGRHCLQDVNCCQTDSKYHSGCYRAQCFKTASSLTKKLGLSESQVSISFQSRLGKAKWLEPLTIHHVKQLAGRGIKNLLVFCPSFVADCLETTYEIQDEVKSEFLASGGENLSLVPSLNSSQSWIEGLVAMVGEMF